MTLSRRQFLKSGLVLVSAGLALPSIFSRAVYSASREQVPGQATTLVVVQMAGGNDGLNTVIPYAEPIYRSSRPKLSIDDKDVIRLDDRIGLHPSLAPLKELWDSGKLAIIEGVGYPVPNRSHFRSMEIWQTASLTGGQRTGWLGRYFDTFLDIDTAVFKGINAGGTLPLSLVAARTAIPSVASLDSYRLQAPARPGAVSDRTGALLDLYSSYSASSPYAALLSATAIGAHQSSVDLQQGIKSYAPAVEYPKTAFGNGLRILAQIINNNMGARVCHIAVGGYDNHSNQKPTHASNLTVLAAGLQAFYKDLEAHGKAGSVLTMTWSEFGRRVQENASGGTDHGTAAPMFAIGGQVKGGVYGEPPSLTDLAQGDLKFTTDFRSVYATVLEKWLGVASAEILGPGFATLGFV